MFNLLLFLNLASIIAFVTGLINPKLVLRGDNRTRRKSSEIYLSVFVLSFIGTGIFAPKPEPGVVIAPATKSKAKVAVAPTQEVTPSPTPEVTPTPTPTVTPASIAFDPAVCSTDGYLPVNGASIALYTTCQYIKTGSIKPESVSIVTWKNGDAEVAVQELQAESGFEKVMWRDYTLAPESGKDVCVHYVDKSVSCLAFSNPDETVGVQDKPQQSPTIPVGSKCDDFATQEQAQAALPNNPQLDRDGDGTACDSLTNSRRGGR